MKLQDNLKEAEQNRLNALIKKNDEVNAKNEKAIAKAEEDADARQERKLERLNTSLINKQDFADQEIEIEEKTTGLIEEQYTRRAVFAREYDNFLAELIAAGLSRQQAANKIQAMQASEVERRLGAVSQAFGRQTIAYKVAATSQAIANTWKGVTEILSEKSVLPFPASVIAKGVAIAGTIAGGFNAVRNINRAAGGGKFLTNHAECGY